MRTSRSRACVLAVSLLAALVLPAAAEARTSVNVGFFYESLAPYGQWYVSAEYGYVWRPTRVDSGWRPYVDGRWLYTDYGWTFVSGDPWGWATFHYGRWYFEPHFGWLWVPGYEWAPAWVTFYSGAGYVGWAPLPPRVSLSVAIGGGIRPDPRAYCFVEERHFADRDVRRHVMPTGHNVRIVSRTRNVTRFSRSGGHYVTRGPAPERIERAAGWRLERHHIVDLREGRERIKERVERGQVQLFRPHIDRTTTAPPPKVRRLSPAEARGQLRVDRGKERGKPPKKDGARHEPPAGRRR